MAEVMKWPVRVKLFEFSSLEIMRKPGDLLQHTDVITIISQIIFGSLHAFLILFSRFFYLLILGKR